MNITSQLFAALSNQLFKVDEANNKIVAAFSETREVVIEAANNTLIFVPDTPKNQKKALALYKVYSNEIKPKLKQKQEERLKEERLKKEIVSLQAFTETTKKQQFP